MNDIQDGTIEFPPPYWSKWGNSNVPTCIYHPAGPRLDRTFHKTSVDISMYKLSSHLNFFSLTYLKSYYCVQGTYCCTMYRKLTNPLFSYEICNSLLYKIKSGFYRLYISLLKRKKKTVWRDLQLCIHARKFLRKH